MLTGKRVYLVVRCGDNYHGEYTIIKGFDHEHEANTFRDQQAAEQPDKCEECGFKYAYYVETINIEAFPV